MNGGDFDFGLTSITHLALAKEGGMNLRQKSSQYYIVAFFLGALLV